jgi:hypothetical protein
VKLTIAAAVLLALGAGTVHIAVEHFDHVRHERDLVRCSRRLDSIGKALELYRQQFGGGTYYPVPAAEFRGDEWLCTLWWSGLIANPRRFNCPAERDRLIVGHGPGEVLPVGEWPTKWNDSFAIGAEMVSYAGRCRSNRFSGASTLDFTADALNGATPMACDKDGKHDHDLNVLYANGMVRVLRDLGYYVGNGITDDPEGRALEFMDDGS